MARTGGSRDARASNLLRVIGTTGGSRMPQTLAGTNAMIEIHEDNPGPVRRAYKDHPHLLFQFMEPDVSESITPSYDTIVPHGRSEAYMSYSSTENRTISFELTFCVSAEEKDGGSHGNVTRHTKWLQSLCLPTYAQGGTMYPPALCRLVMGKFASARGVVTGCEITHKGPFGGRGGFRSYEYPMIASASITFTALNRRPPQASDLLTSVI